MDALKTRASTVIIGLIGLGAVLATALWLDARSQAVTVEVEVESTGTLPSAVASLPTPTTPVAVPEVRVDADEVGRPVPVGRVMRAPHEFRGRYFECVNTLESLPEMHQGLHLDQRFHRLHVSVRCGGDTSGEGATRRGRGPSQGEATLVHVRFDRATATAIPSVGRGSLLLLQGLGTGPTGTPVARFIRLVDHARRPSPLRGHLPDLLSMLVGMPPPASTVRCMSEGYPRLVGQGKGTPSSHVVAQLSCLDHRDVPVAVQLRFSDAVDAQQTLRITKGTVVQMRVLRSAGSQLEADFVGIEAGAAAAQRSDLRLIQLDPSSWRGREVRCQSMGVPPPLESVASALDSLPDSDTKDLSNRRAWLVCRQTAAPPVHLNLFLPRGKEPELLRIGRGTEIAVRVLGASGSHINGLLKGVIGGELPTAGREGDLRRYVLLSASLQGRKLRCTLLHSVLRPLPPPKRGKNQPVRVIRPTRVHCVDAHRTLSGQVFLVKFQGVDAPQRLAKGQVLELRLTGVTSATPTADLQRILPR